MEKIIKSIFCNRNGDGTLTENPLKVIVDQDPQLFTLLENTRELAFVEDGIPLKYKFLLAMSLDAANGAVNGVRSLAVQAMQAGATKEEVMQAIRITQYIFGAGSVYTASEALKDIM
jgi:alkylhydroperoxidase/carboxymuconolactone decarboxylase family protein YurZ